MKFYLPGTLLWASLWVALGGVTSSGINANEILQSLAEDPHSVISKVSWNHGSPNCDTNKEPPIEVYEHDPQSFIIRQNKCLTFEAPFIYVLAGSQKILVLDTGAISSKTEFSLYAELKKILGEEQLSNKEMLVVHSHGHSDHLQGDADFDGRSNVRLVKPLAEDINQFFGFADWPQGQKEIDLGARQVTVIPTPGHQEEAITIYDDKTKWLMTGDTLYPGYIYVKDWAAYRNSIDTLATFATNNEVSAILGAHIEMKKGSTSYYRIGSTYQPNEAKLDLSVQSLHTLNEKLKLTRKRKKITFEDFIIKPMSGFQKMLSNASRRLAR